MARSCKCQSRLLYPQPYIPAAPGLDLSKLNVTEPLQWVPPYSCSTSHKKCQGTQSQNFSKSTHHCSLARRFLTTVISATDMNSKTSVICWVGMSTGWTVFLKVPSLNNIPNRGQHFPTSYSRAWAWSHLPPPEAPNGLPEHLWGRPNVFFIGLSPPRLCVCFCNCFCCSPLTLLHWLSYTPTRN